MEAILTRKPNHLKMPRPDAYAKSKLANVVRHVFM